MGTDQKNFILVA